MDESVLRTDEEGEDEDGADSGDMDPMYDECVRVVCRDGRASTSHLQRRLSLGYNRAARIIDQMEKDGLVGPATAPNPAPSTSAPWPSSSPAGMATARW
jgi:S-DNA-T family DNA segregation ATPase FtsK/SpoIIIE